MTRSTQPYAELKLLPALRPGGTIGIAAPASPPNRERIEAAVRAIEATGFHAVLGDNVWSRYGHLAGRDEERAADLNAMFRRDDVAAILCARGGSGSIRILEQLDYELIAARPKVFIGYSDITSVQLALLARARLPSFFGAMAQPDFARGLAPASLMLLLRLVGEARPAGSLDDGRCEAETRTLVGGTAEGPCVGGTLSLVAASIGTPSQPELNGAIFCFEDIHENPARIERYLTQMLQAGLLQQASGFLIGAATWDAASEEQRRFLTFDQVYRDLLQPLGKPAVVGFPIGHRANPVPLPQGIRVALDADRCRVSVLDAAVR